jgi:hypothetical protein
MRNRSVASVRIRRFRYVITAFRLPQFFRLRNGNWLAALLAVDLVTGGPLDNGVLLATVSALDHDTHRITPKRQSRSVRDLSPLAYPPTLLVGLLLVFVTQVRFAIRGGFLAGCSRTVTIALEAQVMSIKVLIDVGGEIIALLDDSR